MRSLYLSFTVLTVLVLTALVAGFYVSGSPFSQKAISLDQRRISDMTSIKYSVDQYYSEVGKLPSNLSQLNLAPLPQDPESKSTYEYKVSGSTAYSLCTTFSTEVTSSNSQNSRYSYPYLDGVPAYHAKGYGCINLSVSSGITKPVPPINNGKVWRSIDKLVVGYVETSTKTDSETWIYIKDSETSQISAQIFLSDTELIDMKGASLELSSFQRNDKIVVKVNASRSEFEFRATQVQNLSR